MRTMHRPLIRSYIQRIDAPPGQVFPLLCPVRGAEWVEGWADSSELIWSASGVAEPGCVFRTREDGRPDTVWIVSRHDPDHGVLQLERVTPGLEAGSVRVEVAEGRNNTSSVAIRLAIVPISAEGAEAAAARYERRALLGAITAWERSLNHYLRTGSRLRESPR